MPVNLIHHVQHSILKNQLSITYPGACVSSPTPICTGRELNETTMGQKWILFFGVVVQLTGFSFGQEIDTKFTKVESGIFSNTEEKKPVIVYFGSDSEMKELAYKIISRYSYASKAYRIHAMYQAISAYSTKCQTSATSYLDAGSYTYRHMWSTNAMVIRDADQACVQKLAEMEDVIAIHEDKPQPLIDPLPDLTTLSESTNSTPGTFTTGTTWGLRTIHIRETWRYGVATGYGGYDNLKTGSGIVVSSIDTGVLADHEALARNFRTFAGWHDGYNTSNTPVDFVGHGTHTMGTMIGDRGIGVAPGAKWITCRGCLEEGCWDSALLACCQWILCPHDVNSTESEDYLDCYTAPDVVNNSWGSTDGTDRTYERCSWSLRAAGIVPVWSIGNSGPECGTVGSPGDLESVIGVGATNEQDELTWFSSVGPTPDGRLKPDIAAPGMHVKSSWFTSTDSYLIISGTSMAAPHVSGLIALMLERCRLPYETLLEIIQTTAERYNLGTTTQVCGGTESSKFPNNFYGYGRIDAFQAIKKVVEICYLNQKTYYAQSQQNYATYGVRPISSSGTINQYHVYPTLNGGVSWPSYTYVTPSYGPYRTSYGYYYYPGATNYQTPV